jgi:uncharacterized damage-inducible protein DinB
MSRLNTFIELFRHFDWAEEKMLAASDGLTREQLNQPFEIGMGTLRLTLQHIHDAERTWIERCTGNPTSTLPPKDENATIVSIRKFAGETAAKRKQFLQSLNEADIDRPITFTRQGQQITLNLDDIFLQVCNHAMHHRAQAVNMQKQLGLKPPLTEYIFMQVESPSDPQPQLSAEILHKYISYSDWARDRVLDLAAGLSDDKLNQEFNFGMGTICKTLAHLNEVDRWWMENWTSDSSKPFPPSSTCVKLEDLKRTNQKNSEDRNIFIASLSDADLNRIVKAEPEQGRTLNFPLGQTMIEVCNHATHHRSHAINMLRRVGVKVPLTDYAVMKREAKN